MKKIAKFMLALTIASGLSTASLFAQDYMYESDMADYSPASASAVSTAMDMGPWIGWTAVGASIAGLVVVGTVGQSTTNHN